MHFIPVWQAAPFSVAALRWMKVTRLNFLREITVLDSRMSLLTPAATNFEIAAYEKTFLPCNPGGGLDRQWPVIFWSHHCQFLCVFA